MPYDTYKLISLYKLVKKLKTSPNEQWNALFWLQFVFKQINVAINSQKPTKYNKEKKAQAGNQSQWANDNEWSFDAPDHIGRRASGVLWFEMFYCGSGKSILGFLGNRFIDKGMKMYAGIN